MPTPTCPICGTGGQACGDDHMARPPISSASFKEKTVADKPLELKEYEYMVGHVPITAMLTAEHAERLGATAVGEAESPGEGNVVNNEANRSATATRAAEDSGVQAAHADGTDTDSAAEKTRVARNKRAS